MIIDAHMHFPGVGAELDDLLKIGDKIGIDKFCMIGYLDELIKAVKQAPDRIIGLARVVLDGSREIEPEFIDRIREAQMAGLKFISPQKPYDDEMFFELYGKAQSYSMPVLFHTGILNRKPGVVRNCNNMRPIYLDHIGRIFPALKMVMAHLGNPWYEEGSMTCRYNENIVCDLSGSTLKKKDASFIRSLFWWDKDDHPYHADGNKHPFDKIVFGSDVGAQWIENSFNDYLQLLDRMSVPEGYRRKIMGGTIAGLFGII